MKFPAYPRSAKACDTVATAPSSQIQSPLPGVQDFAVTVGAGTLPAASDVASTSPAGDREEPALTSGCAGDLVEAPRSPTLAGGRSTEPALTTAEVAGHAGLSPMLLEASYRDVMQRRAGR